MMSALMQLSEGRPLEPWQIDRAAGDADNFVRSSALGYVAWRNVSVSPELRAFAIKYLRLTKVAEADGYELYVPRTETDGTFEAPSVPAREPRAEAHR
jgi:hypothetical protein